MKNLFALKAAGAVSRFGKMIGRCVAVAALALTGAVFAAAPSQAQLVKQTNATSYVHIVASNQGMNATVSWGFYSYNGAPYNRLSFQPRRTSSYSASQILPPSYNADGSVTLSGLGRGLNSGRWLDVKIDATVTPMPFGRGSVSCIVRDAATDAVIENVAIPGQFILYLK